MASGALHGANWTNSLGVTLRETYTDNTDLTADNEDTDWITSVTPGISLRGEGSRLKLNFDYGLNFNYHTNADSSSDINNRLQTTANAELARNWLFLDARATATQTLVDSFGKSGGDTSNDIGNTENTYTWEVSPHTQHHFGGYADMTTRVTIDQVLNSKTTNSDGKNFNANLSSGRFFPRSPWSVDYSYEKASGYGNSGQSSDYHVLDLSAGYVVNRIWTLNVGAGKEWNDFVSTRSDKDGYRWDASVVWTPSARTFLEVGYSDRFYGSYPTFDFSHRSRRSIWTASYERYLSDSRQLRLANDVFDTEDAFGEPIDDPVTGNPLPVNPDLADSSSSIFLNQVFQTSYTLRTRRTTVTINASFTERKYQDSRRDAKTILTGLFLSRALSGVTNANANLSWERYEDDNNPDVSGERKHNTWMARMGLTRTLTQRTSVSLDYRYRHRNSDVDDDDYTENRISLWLATRWQ